MKIAMASDHGGFGLKEDLRAWLTEQGHQVVDCGCYGTESCDYPEFGEAAARKVAAGECERGIVVCTTGIGISISANKVKGIRCALCGEPWSAEMVPPPQRRQHAGPGGRGDGPPAGPEDRGGLPDL